MREQLSINDLILLFGITLFPAMTFSQNPLNKSNVIIIMTDDQGSIDVNSYGAKDLLTPNMDRLAREGVKFNQFYTAAPVCSPSRAAGKK